MSSRISVALPLSVLALCAAATAQAEHNRDRHEYYNPIYLTGQIGYASGGDDLIDVAGSDDFQAGDGVDMQIGVGIDLAPQTGIALTAGLKINDEDYDNGDARFTRYPLTAVAYVEPVPQLRLGAGITHHLNPEFDGVIFNNGIEQSTNTEFDDATGYVLQADWQFIPQMYAGLRYTGIKYEGDTVDGEIDGSAIGIHIGFSLR